MDSNNESEERPPPMTSAANLMPEAPLETLEMQHPAPGNLMTTRVLESIRDDKKAQPNNENVFAN